MLELGQKLPQACTDQLLFLVARIAYQASDVIVSVQPSLAVDSEFSSHLKRYYGRKERSLVAKNVEAVPEVRAGPQRSFTSTVPKLTCLTVAPLHKTQCRPVAVRLRASSEWPLGLRHNNIQDTASFCWSPLQAGPLPRGHPRRPSS